MAVKIKLQRMGKIRTPEYRVVVADARTRRSGKAIENLGIYQPAYEPSVIRIDSERVQYWLGVGAQPTEPVLALLKVTGDWQKFKGIEGAEGTLKHSLRRSPSWICSTRLWLRLQTAQPLRLSPRRSARLRKKPRQRLLRKLRLPKKLLPRRLRLRLPRLSPLMLPRRSPKSPQSNSAEQFHLSCLPPSFLFGARGLFNRTCRGSPCGSRRGCGF